MLDWFEKKSYDTDIEEFLKKIGKQKYIEGFKKKGIQKLSDLERLVGLTTDKSLLISFLKEIVDDEDVIMMERNVVDTYVKDNQKGCLLRMILSFIQLKRILIIKI